MSKQPEALRLANSMALIGASMDGDADRAAAELRRLHALNERLVRALDAALRTAKFERAPFRAWHEDARDALAAAKGAA